LACIGPWITPKPNASHKYQKIINFCAKVCQGKAAGRPNFSTSSPVASTVCVRGVVAKKMPVNTMPATMTIPQCHKIIAQGNCKPLLLSTSCATPTSVWARRQPLGVTAPANILGIPMMPGSKLLLVSLELAGSAETSCGGKPVPAPPNHCAMPLMSKHWSVT